MPHAIRHRPDLATLNARSAGSAVAHLGIVFTELGDDFLRGTMPVDERTRQPYGLLHGGSSVLLAETLGSMAANLCVEDPATQQAVGLEINANHLRAVKSGVVTGTARPLHLGRSTQVWSASVFGPDDKRIALFRCTQMVLW